MKRGLKDDNGAGGMTSVTVTIAIPMKRGLKVIVGAVFGYRMWCYNCYPDEKGTESSFTRMCFLDSEPSYNCYPDEKGTESIIFVFVRRLCCGYNCYPDEKGTERPHNLV